MQGVLMYVFLCRRREGPCGVSSSRDLNVSKINWLVMAIAVRSGKKRNDD